MENQFGMGFGTVEQKVPEQKQVYKNMKEDPAYGESRGESFVDFRDNVFGYTVATEKDGNITAIGGENGEVPYLEIGNIIRPSGEDNALGGLSSIEDAEIVGFQKPFENGNTDKIVKVKQGGIIVWLKPCQMKKLIK